MRRQRVPTGSLQLGAACDLALFLQPNRAIIPDMIFLSMLPVALEIYGGKQVFPLCQVLPVARARHPKRSLVMQ